MEASIKKKNPRENYIASLAESSVRRDELVEGLQTNAPAK